MLLTASNFVKMIENVALTDPFRTEVSVPGTTEDHSDLFNLSISNSETSGRIVYE